MKGLFINNKKAKDSIYESGLMTYNCLALSVKYSLDYQEIDIDDRTVPTGYDFYFFNYHPLTLQWLDASALKKNLSLCISMVLEVAPNDPFVYCSPRDFDLYCVLDPTVSISNKKVYAFPRPLEKTIIDLPTANNPIPVIGTFGFATKGKGFQHVVDAVNAEFDEAIVKINIPHGDFVPGSKEYADFLAKVCRERAKEGIRVEVTHDFMDKEDLIKWCAANTLNCFLYDRNMPGLAATTDQAIVAQRPLAVSSNDTFRHITAYLKPYPECGLKTSIDGSLPAVLQMLNDWSPENFTKKFEQMLEENSQLLRQRYKPAKAPFVIPLKNKSIFDTVGKRYKKYKRKFQNLKLSSLFKHDDSKYGKEII